MTLVTSDAHAGLKAAVKAILPGAGWQRCRVHFARNVTQKVGSARSKPVNALISTIFAQKTIQAVTAQDKAVTDSLRSSLPEIATMLEAAHTDLTHRRNDGMTENDVDDRDETPGTHPCPRHIIPPNTTNPPAESPSVDRGSDTWGHQISEDAWTSAKFA